MPTMVTSAVVCSQYGDSRVHEANVDPPHFAVCVNAGVGFQRAFTEAP